MSLRSTASGASASRLLIAVLVVVLGSLIANSASAGSGCAQQIIADWSDNGTIDGAYPTDCYQQAIAALPEDLRSYSSAADDINRALQQALLDGADGSEGGDVAGSSDDPGSSSGPGQNGGAGATEPSERAGATTREEPAPSTDGSATAPSKQVSTTPSEAAAALSADEGAGLPLPVVVLIVVAGVAGAVVLAVAGRRLMHDRSDSRK